MWANPRKWTKEGHGPQRPNGHNSVALAVSITLMSILLSNQKQKLGRHEATSDAVKVARSMFSYERPKDDLYGTSATTSNKRPQSYKVFRNLQENDVFDVGKKEDSLAFLRKTNEVTSTHKLKFDLL